MRLSRTVSYAVRATMELAKSERSHPVPCSQLAASGDMPERFLLQILRNLVTHGILRSTRGVEGGYSLSRSPDEVSLLDVIEAIEGPMDSGADQIEGIPREANRDVHDALRSITTSARHQLEAIKISQLLAPPKVIQPEIERTKM